MSLRQYLSTAELEEYADITVTNADEAADQISQAEELIDAYVGFQLKSVPGTYTGVATSGTTTTMIDTSSDGQMNFDDNFFQFCVVEIIDGTAKGDVRAIVSSARADKQITVETEFSVAPDETSVYKIYQLGKFPRANGKDSTIIGNKYYKSIPEAVKRAVAAQVQYVVENGSEFFTGATDRLSESIADYSYTIKPGVDRVIAPKARMYLKGIYNIKGKIV